MLLPGLYKVAFLASCLYSDTVCPGGRWLPGAYKNGKAALSVKLSPLHQSSCRKLLQWLYDGEKIALTDKLLRYHSSVLEAAVVTL